MQISPIEAYDDQVNTTYATSRLDHLKETVKRYPGNKEVREAYENADAAIFDPFFKGSVR
ncbi:MAG: hypothetical protein JO313_00910 [Verrucomicrobia bacterium]|nr:hypothetical protein [Verrucomicrobiota bacterium]MBV9643762.1 hypothetical protein [Verrucomicrobiota bacterium]